MRGAGDAPTPARRWCAKTGSRVASTTRNVPSIRMCSCCSGEPRKVLVADLAASFIARASRAMPSPSRTSSVG